MPAVAGTSTPLGRGIKPFKTTPYSKNPPNGPVITGCCSKPQTCFVRAQVLPRTCASDGKLCRPSVCVTGGVGEVVCTVIAPGELRLTLQLSEAVEGGEATVGCYTQTR